MIGKSLFVRVICFVAALLYNGIATVVAADVVWYDGNSAVTYSVDKNVSMVVNTAIDMFQDDMLAVTGKKACAANGKNAVIVIRQLDVCNAIGRKQLQAVGIDTNQLAELCDGFAISVNNGKIYVAGSNGRGTAYGLLELSRMAGVSPWIWWGDVVPVKRERLTIEEGYSMMQGASVEYRGIFINDEDWSLRLWSKNNYDKSEPDGIGSRTYKRIFQLLLRLRANAVWPGMHEGTKAFFKTAKAKAVADSCGMVIGTSHCEPLLRNNVDEWDTSKRGPYNYITNKEAVQQYWTERLQEVKHSQNNMFTIGMRGIHDGSMEGVKTMDEKHEALQQVIDDQQVLIEKNIGNAKKQMQVFVPYKEVLEIYERGLNVPDNVTLMWCDDNYGYVTRLSTPQEQLRSGGGGVYYHLSYWGRPHDYLWLTTTQPGLIYHEMRRAYDHNVRKLWIANVHDPKLAGYDLELFLDMAWNIDCVNGKTISGHYRRWLCRQFGDKAGELLYDAMNEYYRLCGERRPEFMGWNQVELDKRLYNRGLSPVSDSQLSTVEFGNELARYLDRYDAVCSVVGKAETMIRPELKDAYFAAIKYPVFAAAAHARKMLEAQRARGDAKGGAYSDMSDEYAQMNMACAKSQKAYWEIKELTHYYNKIMAGGKWDGLMTMRPRDLPVFAAPSLPVMLTEQETEEWLARTPMPLVLNTLHNPVHPVKADGAIAKNACQYTTATTGVETIEMLGHSMNAVSIPKDGRISFEFETEVEGDAILYTALIPTQPTDGKDLRYAVSVDGGEETVYSLKEPFRSEGWKQNVLRGQAVRSMDIHLAKGSHTLTIRAIDDNIVADQWMIDYKTDRKFYLFPVR